MGQVATGLANQVRRSRVALVAAIIPATAIVVVAVVASRLLAICKPSPSRTF
jgi:hypothetical protein